MPRGLASSRMCLKFPQSFSLRPGLGSRCPLTLGPPWPRAAVPLPSLLVGGPSYSGLHVQPHDLQSPFGHEWIVGYILHIFMQMTLHRVETRDWGSWLGNHGGQLWKTISLRDITGNLHKLTSLLVCSSAMVASFSPAAVSLSPASISPTSCCFPSLPLLPPKVQEDFIPFRELLVFPGGWWWFIFIPLNLLRGQSIVFHILPTPPGKNKRQYLVFWLEAMLDHHIPYMAWAVGPSSS